MGAGGKRSTKQTCCMRCWLNERCTRRARGLTEPPRGALRLAQRPPTNWIHLSPFAVRETGHSWPRPLALHATFLSASHLGHQHKPALIMAGISMTTRTMERLHQGLWRTEGQLKYCCISIETNATRSVFNAELLHKDALQC